MNILANELSKHLKSAASCNAILTATENEIQAEMGRIADLRKSAEPLRFQLAELQIQEPVQAGPNPDHVAALLSDPTCIPDQSSVVAAVSEARVQEDARQLTMATIEAAIEQVEEQIAGVERGIKVLQNRRAAEFQDFVKSAQFGLLAAFKDIAGTLFPRIVPPLCAIPHLKHQGGGSIIRMSTRFSQNSKIEIEEWQDGYNGVGKYEKDTVFAAPSYMSDRDAEAAIGEFRSFLSSLGLTVPA